MIYYAYFITGNSIMPPWTSLKDMGHHEESNTEFPMNNTCEILEFTMENKLHNFPV